MINNSFAPIPEDIRPQNSTSIPMANRSTTFLGTGLLSLSIIPSVVCTSLFQFCLRTTIRWETQTLTSKVRYDFSDPHRTKGWTQCNGNNRMRFLLVPVCGLIVYTWPRTRRNFQRGIAEKNDLSFTGSSRRVHTHLR